MDLQVLQVQVADWSRRNFGEDPDHKHRPLLGVSEEVGELCHAHLKAEQGIRTNEDHQAAKIDAVGDILIYLADYCTRNGIDLDSAIRNTWREVKHRDWKKNEVDGTS